MERSSIGLSGRLMDRCPTRKAWLARRPTNDSFRSPVAPDIASQPTFPTGKGPTRPAPGNPARMWMDEVAHTPRPEIIGRPAADVAQKGPAAPSNTAELATSRLEGLLHEHVTVVSHAA